MSVLTCPNGHPTTSTDYCDTCGAPLAAGAAGTSAPAARPPSAVAPGPQTCPSCQTDNVADALFCEACGYDFTTGAMPRAVAAMSSSSSSSDLASPTGGVPVAGAPPAPLAPAVPLEWVAEVWVDPDWYAEQDSDEPCPSPGLPAIVPLTVRSVLVGRTSKSRTINPEVDCGTDIGVSRRQAQLTTDGTRWWIEDLQSSNGTYLGLDSGPLPTQPLPPGQRRELAEGDRVYVGAWTRLVVRRATDEEKKAGPA